MLACSRDDISSKDSLLFVTRPGDQPTEVKVKPEEDQDGKVTLTTSSQWKDHRITLVFDFPEGKVVGTYVFEYLKREVEHRGELKKIERNEEGSSIRFSPTGFPSAEITWVLR